MDFFGIDVAMFITTLGYAGVFAVVFAQTGSVFGLVLPGSSFLLFAGFLASQDFLNITWLIIAAMLGSILGDSFGYFTGRRIGEMNKGILKKKHEGFINPRHIARAKTFYRKHGGVMIVFARFVHFTRTLVPTLAGTGKMPYTKFFFYSFVGSALWTIGVPLLGYNFGFAVPAQYIRTVLIALLLMIISSAILKIIRAVNKRTLGKTALCVDIGKVNRGDIGIAGGKGANLGELMREDFAVPEGFIVTTLSYDKFVETNSLDGVIKEGLKDSESGGELIRKEFLKGETPEDVKKEILKFYKELGGFVAVRSSATAEDLPEAAFAGQQDTFLNIKGEEELMIAVKKAWASLWTDRAIAYRKKQDIKNSDLKLAVVVQRMAEAESAGVMFTVNPITGKENETIINASAGLGESVVSGMVTPDYFLIKKKFSGWKLVEKTPGKKEVVVRVKEGGGGGTEEVKSAEDSKEFSISEDTAIELAKVGSKIDRLFGTPQDIEWTWSSEKDGEKISIVQARPMTGLPGRQSRIKNIKMKAAGIIAELFAIRPYPLDASFWWKKITTLLNLMLSPIGIHMKPFTKVFDEKNGVITKFNGKLPIRPSLGILIAPLKLIYLSIKYNPAKWKEDPLIDKMLQKTSSMEKEDLESKEWDELLRMAHEALEETVVPVGVLRYRYLPPAGIAMGALLLQLKILGKGKYFSELVEGMDTKTIETNRALETLSRVIRNNEKLNNLFEEVENYKSLYETLKKEPEAEEFLKEFDNFLDKYGHRETHFTGPSQPTWKGAPENVLGIIKSFIESGGRASEQKNESWIEAKEIVLTHSALRVPVFKYIFLKTLARARYFLQIREDTHFYATLALPISRNIFLECGRRMVQKEILKSAEDVFYLTIDELENIEEEDKEELKDKVELRKNTYEELKDKPIIDVKYFRSKESGGEVFLLGIPGSAGIAEGTARVVKNTSEFSKIKPGDILIAPYTNPAWTPLFERVAGVVVDTGGVVSHAAIVAREYRIPAVMSTVDGTKKLTDGQKIIINGGDGTVKLSKENIDK